MTSVYAQNTNVSVDRSTAEIERILSRYGADQFLYGWDQKSAVIAFRVRGRSIKINLSLPDKNSEEFQFTPLQRKQRSKETAESAYEQAVRQRWRALTLIIKAKLEAVQLGITTFEDEFLAFTMLPSGATVGQWLEPQLKAAYDGRNQMPALLPGS